MHAACTTTFSSHRGKRQFVRAAFELGTEGARATPVGGHGSHLVGDLAHANALIVVAEDTLEVAAGDTVDVMVLDREF